MPGLQLEIRIQPTAHLGWQVTGLQGKALPSAFLSTRWESPKLLRQGKWANAGEPGSQAPLSILVEENQMKEMHSYCVFKDNSHRPRTSDSIYTKPQVSTTELW